MVARPASSRRPAAAAAAAASAAGFLLLSSLAPAAAVDNNPFRTGQAATGFYDGAGGVAQQQQQQQQRPVPAGDGTLSYSALFDGVGVPRDYASSVPHPLLQEQPQAAPSSKKKKKKQQQPPQQQAYAYPQQQQQLQQEEPHKPEYESHIILVEPEIRRSPILKGHVFFILGLFLLGMCLASLRGDPAARGLSFFEGVQLNARSLLQREDVVRSLFVVLAAAVSPLLILYGAFGLMKTFPRYFKWAIKEDEIGLAQLALLVLYCWVFLMNPAGKRMP